MQIKKRSLKKEIREKLHDTVLQDALGRFAEAYPSAREKALADIPDIDAVRQSLRDIKRDTVAQIDVIADRFEQEAKNRGITVFRASNGAEVRKYILDLCAKRHVTRIVKSKTMASEEIDLNKALEASGIQVRETDLGEWIISLAGHKPSHMVMPAIHLNRYQVADYFSRELHRTINPDIASMVHTARVNLRRDFWEAQMGITGANFAIAENGAIGLVTNEGNARLVTSLPPIHIAIIGYEKLVPSIRDLLPALTLLPRCATAQRMVSYFSMIEGPTPTMVKRDGRWIEEEKEVHYILLDNGRLKAAHDTHLKEIFQCIRCGSCLNVCPIYTLVGGHVYGGHTYAGGIGTILTALFSGMEDFKQFNELCIGCRMCTTVCPGMINIPELIEELRKRFIKEKGNPFFVDMVFDVVANRKLFHRLLRIASVAQKPFTTGSVVRHLPLFFAVITRNRSLPAIAEVSLRDRIHQLIKPIDNPIGKVGFFSGCTMDFVFPETGENVIKVLQNLNIEVVYPEKQGCCGKPIAATGDTVHAQRMARQNIEAFEEEDIEIIVCACPAGVEQLRNYADLLKDDQEWAERAQAMSNKIREFSSFVLEEYKKAGRLNKSVKKSTIPVTYHDSCHLKRVLGIYQEPRLLIESVGKFSLAEMKDADKCCGMSGTFGVRYPELSVPVLEQKMKNIMDTNVATVVCACPGCMVQLRGGLDQRACGITVYHIADILAENVKEKV